MHYVSRIGAIVSKLRFLFIKRQILLEKYDGLSIYFDNIYEYRNAKNMDSLKIFWHRKISKCRHH